MSTVIPMLSYRPARSEVVVRPAGASGVSLLIKLLLFHNNIRHIVKTHSSIYVSEVLWTEGIDAEDRIEIFINKPQYE